MGIKDEKLGEKEYEELTVDLSKQKLKKLERATSEQQSATALIVDDNELQKLDNMDSYSNLKQLSAVNNQIFRMYWVCNLVNLEELNLSNNAIATIEGLRDLKLLKNLNLAKNKIKTMDNLNNKILLEKIDLSDNNITHISDLSSLQNLKALYLHSNRICHLKQCDKNLPKSLEILTLCNNLIEDLNEVSHLVHLICLKELSVAKNPCVEFPENQTFNYRPFIKNWCSSIEVIDDRVLNDIECLKAEWLYSQGRGRSFRLGEHAALIEYLHGVCPREDEEDMENEDVKKLKLILSKAQQHQKQLREELTTGQFPVKDPPKVVLGKKKSTLLPERMVSSFSEHLQKDHKNTQELMSKSLDSEVLKTSSFKGQRSEMKQTPLETSTTFIPLPDTLISPDVAPSVTSHPASVSGRTSRSSSRNSSHSAPDSKRRTPTKHLVRQRDNSSPLNSHKLGNVISRGSTPVGTLQTRNTPSPGRKGTVVRQPSTYLKETSEDEDSEILALRVMAVQQRANQRKQKMVQGEPKRRNVGKAEESVVTENAEWKAATCIQKRWRGYRARNLNKDVLAACSSIQMSRMQDYITKVMADMEATRDALEKNRKLLLFHMQAIHGLWKKMSTAQPAVVGKRSEENVSLQGLAETCAKLNMQVESLQTLVKTMLTSKTSLNPMATQTEIVAVHTPQGDSKEIFFAERKQSELLGNCPLFGEVELVKNSQEKDDFSNDKMETEQIMEPLEETLPSSEQFTKEFQAVVLKKLSVKLHESEMCLAEQAEETPKSDEEDQEAQGTQEPQEPDDS